MLAGIAKAIGGIFLVGVLAFLGMSVYRISMSQFDGGSAASSGDGTTSSAIGSNSGEASTIESSLFDVSDSKATQQTNIAESSSDSSSSAAPDERSSESSSSSSSAKKGFPIPLIATLDDVYIHSPIRPDELEGILFHQASFETAYPLYTELEEADPETMQSNPDYRIAEEQPTGDAWLDAVALHLWRDGTPTEMDTSIDVGAEAGTQVYAPVTGTVVKVNTYRLYDTCEDYEVHIQPDGRPDLDVVEIHIDDVSVEAGDKVTGGVTPIAVVRDLAAEDITDIQLAYYTKEGHGNHTHVQVNNADYPEYRETRLKDAYEVK